MMWRKGRRAQKTDKVAARDQQHHTLKRKQKKKVESLGIAMLWAKKE